MAMKYINQNILKNGAAIDTSSNSNSSKYKEMLQIIPGVDNQNKVLSEIEKFERLDPSQSEYSKLSQYLDEVFSIPFEKYSEPFYDIQYCQKILDESLYGMEKVKERIIEMVGQNQIQSKLKQQEGFVLMLNGPPGTGKSTIAKNIAKALKREHRFISFGGVNDQSFIKGHKRTYMDSQSGIFIQELIKAKTMNPVFVLDEIDKINTSGHQGNPYYSLLELLNKEESKNFQDHYLDFKVDFSKCIFILTSNSSVNMIEALKSRIEIIEVSSYIEDEKLQIAEKYLIPKICEKFHVPQSLINISREDVRNIIYGWCYFESGVRNLNKYLEKVIRKYLTQLVDDQEISLKIEESKQITDEMIQELQIQPINLTENKLIEFLESPIFDYTLESRKFKQFQPGILNVLTAVGFSGMTDIIEVHKSLNQTEIKEDNEILISSGNLKQVMKESCQLSLLNAFDFLTNEQQEIIKKQKLIVHFPNGMERDGSGSGACITSAILSYIKNQPIDSQTAIVGEITLNGEILEVSQIKSKIIAAKSIDITRIIVPKQNLSEIMEFTNLLKNLQIIGVTKYSQVYDILFNDKIDDSLMQIQDGQFIVKQRDQIVNL